MENNSSFLGYLHSFRGFAILCVVIVHAAVMPMMSPVTFEMDTESPIYRLNEILFHDSTIYFALISGLLFAAILQPRGYKKFYRSKFLNIFLPYLFFTLLLSLSVPPKEPGASPTFHSDIFSYISLVGKNLLFGKAMPIYWYLPVLFILYFVTPILDWLFKQNESIPWLALPIMLAPLLISRNPIEFDYVMHWQDFVYFIGTYAVGMWFGFNLKERIGWLEGQQMLLIIVVLLSTGLLAYFYWFDVNLVGFVSLRESVFYIQKLAIAALVIVFFKKLGENQSKIWTSLATDAFAIYFIHFIMIFICFSLMSPLMSLDNLYPLNVILTIIIITIGSLLLSKLVIFILKKILRRYSRMVIGS